MERIKSMNDFITFLVQSEKLSMEKLIVIGVFILLGILIWRLPEIYRAYKEFEKKDTWPLPPLSGFLIGATMSVVSKLQIVLEATTTAFDRGLRLATYSLQGFARNTQQMHDRMDRFVRQN